MTYQSGQTVFRKTKETISTCLLLKLSEEIENALVLHFILHFILLSLPLSFHSATNSNVSIQTKWIQYSSFPMAYGFYGLF